MAPTKKQTASTENWALLIDAPAESPGLKFDDYAKTLAEIIERSEPRFAIGIFGDWGSGKTTLMDAIERQVDSLVSSTTVNVRFSAWRYEREEQLIVPLLDHIRDAAIEWSKQGATGHTKARKMARRIGRVTKAILAGFSLQAGIPGGFQASFDANASLNMPWR